MILKVQKFMKADTALAAALFSALMLAVAFGFQFAGYAPCKLCWVQRYPYMLVIAVVLVARLLGRQSDPWVKLLAVIGVAASGAVGGYHAGVEYGWWESFLTCSGNLDLSGDVDDVLAQIKNAALVRCDEIPWSLFGISMAGWNALTALLAAALLARATTWRR